MVKQLTKQIVVRVDGKLHRALQDDARRNGRTVAQSVRFWLTKQLAADNGGESK